MPLAAAIPGIVGAGSSIIGGILGRGAAGNAAAAAAAAAGKAADYSKQNLGKAQDYIGTQQKQETANLDPFLKTGQNASNALDASMNSNGGVLTPFSEKFTAPTDVTEQNDPGYQFRLAQGMKALQQSAAAKGILQTGGTANALQRYGQDYASTEYGNVYNRAMQEYQNRFNVFQTNQANQYNRESGTAQMGLQAGNALNASLGQNTNLNTNALLDTARQVGNDYTNQGSATASGYLGQGNALAGAVNGVGSAVASMPWQKWFPSGNSNALSSRPVNTYDPVSGTYPG